MENNIYQVNNKIFRDVFLSILSAIAGIYFAVAKLFSSNGLHVQHWLILAGLASLSVLFIARAIKRNQTIEQDNYTI